MKTDTCVMSPDIGSARVCLDIYRLLMYINKRRVIICWSVMDGRKCIDYRVPINTTVGCSPTSLQSVHAEN